MVSVGVGPAFATQGNGPRDCLHPSQLEGAVSSTAEFLNLDLVFSIFVVGRKI